MTKKKLYICITKTIKMNKTQKSANALKHMMNALLLKQEIKMRVQNGENFKKIAKEKGIKIVQPV